MNEAVILDASAVLALLNQEAGYEKIEEVLSRAVISTVNFAEVLTVLTNIGIPIEEAEEAATDMLKEIIPFDQRQAAISASFRKITKPYGLSFGDRACLALAKVQGSNVFTADKIWGKLHIPGIKIHIIR